MPFVAEIEGVREALGAWLMLKLGATFPTLEVLSEWPDMQDLPEMAVSILATGEADIQPHNPIVISSTPTDAINGLVTYAYGYAADIQLELDCWSNNKAKRDALALAVRDALDHSPEETLGAGTWPRLSKRMYLSLPIDALYGAIFTYRFTSVPTLDESSSAAEKNEWRSHFRGSADGPLWAQDTIALIKRLHVAGKLGPGKIGATNGNVPLAILFPRS